MIKIFFPSTAFYFLPNFFRSEKSDCCVNRAFEVSTLVINNDHTCTLLLFYLFRQKIDGLTVSADQSCMAVITFK